MMVGHAFRENSYSLSLSLPRRAFWERHNTCSPTVAFNQSEQFIAAADELNHEFRASGVSIPLPGAAAPLPSTLTPWSKKPNVSVTLFATQWREQTCPPPRAGNPCATRKCATPDKLL